MVWCVAIGRCVMAIGRGVMAIGKCEAALVFGTDLVVGWQGNECAGEQAELWCEWSGCLVLVWNF